jgi:hypothetical protein
MAALLNTAVTTAVTASVGPTLHLSDGVGPRTAYFQCTFAYGSGGTTTDVYVQTSIDNGNTWIDIINFHFATTSLVVVYGLNSGTSVTAYTPTDGTLSQGTWKDGILGNLFRTKITTTGTYAATNLRVDLVALGSPGASVN